MNERQEIASALGVDIDIVVCKIKKDDDPNKKELIYTIKNEEKIRKKIKFENVDIFTKYEFFFHGYSFDDFSIKGVKDIINIKNIIFENCYFQEINLNKTECSDFIFSNCEIKNVVFDDCVFKEALKINAESVKLGNCDFKGSAIIKSEQIKEISSLRPLSEIKGDLLIKSNKPIEKISLKYTSFYGACIFKNNTFIELDLSHSLFGKSVQLNDCIFKNKVDLSHSYFKSDVFFSNCQFGTEVDSKKMIDLSSITFEKNVKFDESKFNHFVAFHTTSFKGTGSFYKCEFNTIPNFSPADFGGVLNINNAKWGENNKGFEYENVKELVEKAYKSNNSMENVINLRSSFSGMKHKLIEQDNLLDAQNFHKAELYCKEIELKDRIEQEYLSNRNKVKIKIDSNVLLKERFCVLIATLISCWLGFFYFEHKSVLASFLYGSIFVLSLEIFMRIVIWLYRFVLKECNEIKYKCLNFDLWFDWIILLLYRYTSEHHTNINRILHVLLIVIVSYGFTLFVSDYIINYALGNFLIFLVLFCIAAFFFKKFFHQNMLLINLKVLFYFFLLLIFVCLVAKITYILCYIFSIFILFSFYSLKNSFCIFISRAIIYFIAILILAFQPEILNPIIGINKSSEYKNSKLNELMDNISYDKLVALASNVTQEAPSALNTKSPREIIIENKNIIKNSIDLNASFDSFKQAIKQDEVIYATRNSISVIYIILLILCIFSLQKTARKNSIVPS